MSEHPSDRAWLLVQSAAREHLERSRQVHLRAIREAIRAGIPAHEVLTDSAGFISAVGQIGLLAFGPAEGGA